MVKLYFKKLLLIFCLLLMWFAVSAFIATALGLGNDLINYTAYALCMVASGVISTVAAGVIKARDLMTKVEYVTEALVNRPKFWGEVRRILKSKPFIAEALGFASWLVPLMVYVCCFPENAEKPLYQLILTSLLLITVLTFMFALFDLAVTFIVRKIWMRKF
ncbi:MAG: hypothetical protein J6Q76_08115 [Clostridia bacterium]|nr:hypothetical protein [Clostridia bacterium]